MPQEWGRTELAAHKLGDPEAAAVRDFFKVRLTGLASIARRGLNGMVLGGVSNRAHFQPYHA